MTREDRGLMSLYNDPDEGNKTIRSEVPNQSQLDSVAGFTIKLDLKDPLRFETLRIRFLTQIDTNSLQLCA